MCLQYLEQEDRCPVPELHSDRIDHAAGHMPGDDELCDLAELYKTFGDSTRVKILYALMDEELCVCDIAAILGVSQTAVSHQLRLLKQSRLVKARRDGKNVFYMLSDDHVHDILNLGAEHLREMTEGRYGK